MPARSAGRGAVRRASRTRQVPRSAPRWLRSGSFGCAGVKGRAAPACRRALRDLHREQAAPFLRALKDLGTPDLQLTAQLLGGVLEAAMSAIESGSSLTAVTERTLTLVRAATGVVQADVRKFTLPRAAPAG